MTRSCNSTVLGVAPLSTTLPVISAVLVALFVLMKPETTGGFTFFERLVFWSVHIGTGLLSLVLASYLLRPRAVASMPLPLALLMTGVIAAAFLAPAYLLFEYLLPSRLADEPDDWLDFFAGRGLWQAVVAEFIEVAPMFVAAWFAINLPLLFARPETDGGPPDKPENPDDNARKNLRVVDEIDNETDKFFSLLPKAIGRELVAVSSDLHYLHVHTTLGKCMVLCTLREATEALGDSGMLIHRSHWVAHTQVQRLVRQGTNWECLMSNGLRVPVSRRSKTKVAAWYGRDAKVVPLARAQDRVS